MTQLTMVRTSLSGGIGATCSAMARFFHPSKKIREKWPHDEKRRLTGVLVVGEGNRHVNRKEHPCYLVRIPEIDDSSIFHIVKKNFKVEVAPPVVFESEVAEPVNVPAPTAPSTAAVERASDRNVISNVEGTGTDVKDLACQGIAVDDDNEPVLENANPPVAGAAPPEGTWEKPAICPCRASYVSANNPGKWKKHRWDQIVEYDELRLFRMCFPEEWIVDVLIPTTNKDLVNKLSLQEFYVFLGIIFYIACFNGIEDRELWWLTKPVDMFSGAPFRLNSMMTYSRFRNIMQAIRYTDKATPLLFNDPFHEVRQMIDAFNNY